MEVVLFTVCKTKHIIRSKASANKQDELHLSLVEMETDLF